MHVCTVASRLLNPLNFSSQLIFQGVVESSLVFAKVALDDGDGPRWKIENLNPVDGVVL